VNEIEDSNLQLTQIKNMDFSSKPEVFEDVLHDDDILNRFYDVGSCKNLIIVEVGSANFGKAVQFLDNVLEDLYSLCDQPLDVNGFDDAEEMVLTNGYASLLQVIDAGEEGFLEDGFVFLCDVVDRGDDNDILISHWFYVFMLDDIREEIQGTQVKSIQMLILEIMKRHVLVVARLRVDNTKVFEDQDLKVEASCAIEMYRKAAVSHSKRSLENLNGGGNTKCRGSHSDAAEQLKVDTTKDEVIIKDVQDDDLVQNTGAFGLSTLAEVLDEVILLPAN
ncbi:hypothetical protein L7F22_068595, partial [Adiantum nelumboides]|nr:hypothetical protein [Adiantum nelumboides]